MKLRCDPSHILLLVSLVMMAGCSSAQPSAGLAGKSASSDRARPILHLDFRGPTPRTAVDDANGRRVAVLDDVYKAAWNPDGTQFVALCPDQERSRLVLKVFTL